MIDVVDFNGYGTLNDPRVTMAIRIFLRVILRGILRSYDEYLDFYAMLFKNSTVMILFYRTDNIPFWIPWKIFCTLPIFFILKSSYGC